MIADLHAHYPMHVLMDEPARSPTLEQMMRTRDRAFPDKLRALVLRIASRFLSDRDLWSGHRISVPFMQSGGVGVALSVLYSAFEEMNGRWPDGPPADYYFDKLIEQLEAVEDEVGGWDASVIRIVRNLEQLDAALADRAIALVHCVEGGFHLGDEDDQIKRNVAALARRGVGYVTVGHLFYREVATSAPAIPFISFLPDRWFDRLFGQAKAKGLTHRGRTIVEALYRNKILVDLSHMRPDALKEALDLLDELDPDRTMPVVSTHAGCRFGKQVYMHDPETIERIARRDGVIGLIMAQYQMNDGVRKKDTKTLPESLEVIYKHIDCISEITGNHRHAALGTDLDGFIKPTLGGIETMADLKHLDDPLHDRYGADADLITSDNAIRLLRTLWSL